MPPLSMCGVPPGEPGRPLLQLDAVVQLAGTPGGPCQYVSARAACATIAAAAKPAARATASRRRRIPIRPFLPRAARLPALANTGQEQSATAPPSRAGVALQRVSGLSSLAPVLLGEGGGGGQG